MKYLEKYDLYIDDDLVVYAECHRDNCPRGVHKGNLYQPKMELSNEGYLRVPLMRNGKKRKYAYHRIIAEAFIPNPDGKPTVDHINRNRLDNRLCNLRWATHKEQQDNTRYVEQGIAKFGVRCCEDVREYNRRYGIMRRQHKH